MPVMSYVGEYEFENGPGTKTIYGYYDSQDEALREFIETSTNYPHHNMRNLKLWSKCRSVSPEEIEEFRKTDRKRKRRYELYLKLKEEFEFEET